MDVSTAAATIAIHLEIALAVLVLVVLSPRAIIPPGLFASRFGYCRRACTVLEAGDRTKASRLPSLSCMENAYPTLA